MSAETVGAILGVAAVLLDGFTILRAVTHVHGVHRTLAWIFAILAFPIVGALAYLALASPSVKRTRRRKALSAAAARAAVLRSARGLAQTTETSETLFALTTRLTGLPPTGANEVELLAENEGAYRRIEEAIEGAERSVWAEYYIVRNDATGRRFLELLAKKAAEGLDVRFVYDAVGSLHLDRGRLDALRSADGRVAMFLPLNPLRRRWSVHLRNHRKLVVVDGARVFTGGMNVGDEYSGRSRRAPERSFRDTHLEIRGPAASCFLQVFADDWAFATEEQIDPESLPAWPRGEGTALVAALPSGPDQEENASWLVYFSAIAAARRSVYLATPYFIPDEALESALVATALRGVDVRLLLPERCDVLLAGLAARTYLPGLLRAGVRIWRYQPSMLHSKTLLVDDEVAVVGSANADIRSFRLNFEIGALVHDREFAQRLQSHFLGELQLSVETKLEDLLARPFHLRLADGVARLLSPLL